MVCSFCVCVCEGLGIEGERMEFRPIGSQKKNTKTGWIEMTRGGNPRKVKTLIVYWSGTGNTEKVAKAIHRALKRKGLEPTIKRVKEAKEVDLYDYDLVFLGSPSHTWMPAQPVLKFIKEKRKEYAKRGLIKPCAPKIPGKNAVVFCTYSGPHTGINEAIPAGKYMHQFFEHLGFDVRAEWYVVGEFRGNELLSTKGANSEIYEVDRIHKIWPKWKTTLCS